MADIPSTNVALVNVVREGDRWRGYIETPWFRYFISGAPEGSGTTNTVLHGNPSGAGTWSPVDLAADVTGTLPFTNGGTGLTVGPTGGVVTFSSPTTLAPTAAGLSNQVLHGGAVPFFQRVDLTSDIQNVLSILNGGTGSSFGTGTGIPVFDTNPSLTNPSIFGGTIFSAVFNLVQVVGQLLWQAGSAGLSQIGGSNSNVVSATAVATTLVSEDAAMIFIVKDRTSNGMSIGLMDAAGVVMVTSGVTNVTFSRLAATGLQATVTGGANPRTLSTFAIQMGPA